MDTNKSYIKNRLIALGVLALFLLLILLAYNRAFIRIDVTGGSEGTGSYRLTNQKTGSVISFESDGSSVKKLVPKGSYEVLVSKGETSFFKYIKTGSFLTTKKVSAGLKPERQRTFVGNNPESCMSYVQNILISYSCNGSSETLKKHLPANALIPTTTEPVGNRPGEVIVSGVVKQQDRTLVLVNGLGLEDGNASPTALFELSPTIALANRTFISDISFDNFKRYSIKEYRDGFVIYDSEMQDIRYYTQPGADYEKITIPAPEDEKLKPANLTVSGDSLAVSYTYVSGGAKAPDAPKGFDGAIKVRDGKAGFVIYKDGKTKTYLFKGGFIDAGLCGKNYFCALNGPDLTVYQIGGKELQEKFVVNGVTYFMNAGELVVIRNKDVMSINIDSMEGKIDNSLGEYEGCGLSKTNGGYLLCVEGGPENSDIPRSALFIDQTKENADSIDKKVLALQKLPFVSSVSAYGSFIYIVPELGESVYNEAVNGYLPDPVIKQKAADDINKALDEIGINRSLYNVINTQP